MKVKNHEFYERMLKYKMIKKQGKKVCNCTGKVKKCDGIKLSEVKLNKRV